MKTKTICACEMYDEYFGHEEKCPMAKNYKPQHTPPPLRMEYECDGTPITAKMLTEKLGVSLFQAQRIVQAVNAHEFMRQTLEDIYYQADPDETHVIKLQSMARCFKRWIEHAIAKAEDR